MSQPNSRNVFISFRFEDGNDYKDKLSKLFDANVDTIDYSEDVNRTKMSEPVIKEHLYKKLKRSSVTIISLTPKAVSYKIDIHGNIDDWIYDEVRYSLEDRENNRTNGLIAVYVPEAKDLLLRANQHKCDKCTGYQITTIFEQENLFRKNMMNVKEKFKKNMCANIYNSDFDSYCSLISLDQFEKNISRYIDIAIQKRENIEQYNITKHL